MPPGDGMESLQNLINSESFILVPWFKDGFLWTGVKPGAFGVILRAVATRC